MIAESCDGLSFLVKFFFRGEEREGEKNTRTVLYCKGGEQIFQETSNHESVRSGHQAPLTAVHLYSKGFQPPLSARRDAAASVLASITTLILCYEVKVFKSAPRIPPLSDTPVKSFEKKSLSLKYTTLMFSIYVY